MLSFVTFESSATFTIYEYFLTFLLNSNSNNQRASGTPSNVAIKLGSRIFQIYLVFLLNIVEEIKTQHGLINIWSFSIVIYIKTYLIRSRKGSNFEMKIIFSTSSLILGIACDLVIYSAWIIKFIFCLVIKKLNKE